MKALLALSIVALPALAAAQEPTTTPEATPIATPAATPEATPSPVHEPTPAPIAPVPTLERAPRTWELEAAMHSVGIFDRGMHVFSSESYLPGPELRLRRAIAPAHARLAVAPELSYGFAHAARSYPASASAELWLQRFSAGARTTLHHPRFGAFTPFARTGASGLWGTALAHDAYRDYREEAYGWGLYGSAGVEVDLTALSTNRTRFVAGAEVGHLYTGGLTFGEMGTLDVNGTFYSLDVSLRF